MQTMGGGFICLGAVFFIVSLLSIWWVVSERRLRRVLRGTRVTPCSDLLRGREQPSVAAVWGCTGAGPEGTLRAPLSGEECIWYHLEVVHTQPDDDGPNVIGVYSGTRGDLIAVTDSSGTVFVEGKLLRMPIYDDGRSDPVAVETLVEATRYSAKTGCKPGSALEELVRRGVIRTDMLTPFNTELTTVVTERIVRAGQQLLVMAHPVRHHQGLVVLDSQLFGVKGVSSRSLSELISVLGRAIQRSTSVAKAFPLITLVLIGMGYAAVWWSHH